MPNVLDVRCAAHVEARKIDEEQVLVGVIRQALAHRHAEQLLAKFHRVVAEDTRIHQGRCPAHHRREVHPLENVLLQVCARRDLDQFEPFGTQAKDAALGDVEHRLLPLDGLPAAERTVLDGLDELLRRAVFEDVQPAVFDAQPQLASGKGTDEDDLLGILRDIDETTGTGQAWPELGDVKVAFAVGLRQAKESDVDATAIVKVELAGLIDDRLGIGRRAEAEPAGGNSADHAGLGG